MSSVIDTNLPPPPYREQGTKRRQAPSEGGKENLVVAASRSKPPNKRAKVVTETTEQVHTSARGCEKCFILIRLDQFVYKSIKLHVLKFDISTDYLSCTCK